jgi:UDP-glucose 4-epimerase
MGMPSRKCVLTFTGGPSKTKFMAERKTKAQRPLRLALTGAHTFLGRRLIERMEADPNCSHILVLDIEPSDVSGAKSRFVRLDLTHPLADGRAAQALVEDEIDVLCHLAFLAIPSHSRRGQPASRWIRDKIVAERELSRLQKDRPEIITTALRFGMTLGPTIRNFHTRVFRRQLLPRIMGYNPLMQFLHEDDAEQALVQAIKEDHPGAYNIVGSGVIPYTNILAIGHRFGVPLPHGFAYSAASLLWNMQLVDTPGKFLDYFRFTWLADDRKMREKMKFEPEYSSRDTLVTFYGRDDLEVD